MVTAIGAVVAAIIAGLATVSAPVITKLFERKTEPSSSIEVITSTSPGQRSRKIRNPPPGANINNGDHNSLNDQSNNSGQQVGPISGGTNQINQISGSNGITINQLPPASSHPVTFDMGRKWTLDDFAETVRNGNLPAIKEYLNPKDGFDPNALWNSNVFVLELPLSEGTKNFPEILKLFKETGKLDWNAVNEGSIWAGIYGHPITLQWALLQEAANKKQPVNLKVLLDAGADPSQLIADETKAFNTSPRGDLLYKGELTGRSRDRSGAHAEQELTVFKSIGYPLPNLSQAIADASRTGQACEQEITNQHSLKELMALAHEPPETPSSRDLEWHSYQGAVSYLRNKLRFGPLAWQGDDVEYARAVAAACNANSTPF